MRPPGVSDSLEEVEKPTVNVYLSWESLCSLTDAQMINKAVQAFQYYLREGQITMGGKTPASDPVIDILSQKYDPRVDCDCDGVYSVPDDMDIEAHSQCVSVRTMLAATQKVIQRHDEWYLEGGLFSPEKLSLAVSEALHFNANTQPLPDICQGPQTLNEIPYVQAPDRRPHKRHDTAAEIYHRLYPTTEKIKLCTDAKYYFAVACSAGMIEEGLARAMADAGNDILIGDYCEAAEKEEIKSLQRTGGAALAFIRLCHLGGHFTD
ncbi:hypothetical protein FQN57_001070 [Myotisia sp. PD_48]|nr:hypothetical protein FQN57_001070 [Myotisia sp. PD_48]